MPGLVPGIHVLGSARQGVDGRVKPGHDERRDSAVGWAKARSAVPTICP